MVPHAEYGLRPKGMPICEGIETRWPAGKKVYSSCPKGMPICEGIETHRVYYLLEYFHLSQGDAHLRGY